MTNKQIYLCGDMLTHGAQRQRQYESDELRALGYKVYAPQEDASINDKANVDNNGLAERIVRNDTQGIMSSDIIVADVHENGKGTLVELGQIKGMRDMAALLSDAIQVYEDGIISAEDALEVIIGHHDAIMSKKILPHNTDIRRANTALQSGDRREYGVNQYVYGTVLDLTSGHGFYEFDEILDVLNENSTKDNV